jgi:hypothetical protein
MGHSACVSAARQLQYWLQWRAHWTNIERRIAAPREVQQMSSHDLSTAEELVRLTRVASQASDLSTLVSAQHYLQAALRHALVLEQWPRLDQAQSELQSSPALAARFNESLHHVLERPELSSHGLGAHWHGLVLAIPVAITSQSGTLVAVPAPLLHAMRETLQAQFPGGTGLRLVGHLTPQLIAHSMRTQALYELVRELAAGDGAIDAGSRSENDFVLQGRSLGRHYLFGLAFTAHPDQLELELPRDLRTEPAFVKWAAAQTELINNDLAERGLQALARVYAPQRLREMLSLPPVLGDVREVDAFLDHVAAQHGIPIPMLRADLSVGRIEETGLRIVVSDRKLGAQLAECFYKLGALGAEAGAYRVAVRLASAGVELWATDEALRRAVDRAMTLAAAAPTTETSQPMPVLRTLGAKSLWSRFSRSPKHPS